MSRLHLLEATGNQSLYRVILHEAVSAGNNSAGVPWSTALKNSGLAKTRMNVGTESGQITTAEKAEVEAGTVVEGEFFFQDDPADNNTVRAQKLDAHATRYLAELKEDLSVRLKLFGLTRP